MTRFALLVLASAAALAGCKPQPPAEPAANTDGLPYKVEAAADAVYELKCAFKAVKIVGGGVANRLDLSGKGPQSGGFPGEDARCSLKQTAGPGPVTLTITKAGPHVAKVEGPGQSADVFVF